MHCVMVGAMTAGLLGFLYMLAFYIPRVTPVSRDEDEDVCG